MSRTSIGAEELRGIISRLGRIAEAISPDALPGHDAAGGTVTSLTEATMGITAGLLAVAEAISDLADAVRESKETR